jgi:hypothetical protein
MDKIENKNKKRQRVEGEGRNPLLGEGGRVSAEDELGGVGGEVGQTFDGQVLLVQAHIVGHELLHLFRCEMEV